MMTVNSFLFFLINLLCLSKAANQTTSNNNYGVLNPLVKQADPQPISVVVNGTRTYYFPASNYGGGEVYMYSSTNLSDVYLGSPPQNFTDTALSNTGHTIFQFTPGVHQSPEAPAMFKWNDTVGYVMYVSSDGPEGNRIYALQNDGKDLNSTWSFAGVVQYTDGTPITGYDAFPFNHPNGNKYLLYTNITTIFINQIDPEYGFATLDYPTEPQEDNLNGTVVASRYYEKYVEAPDVMILNETLNVLWTENDYFSPNYTTYGRAISTKLDPLDPDTWKTGKKVELIASNNQTGVYGTGSVGTFIGPNDQPWIAYTCFYQDQAFNRSGPTDPRVIQAQPLIIKDDVIQPITPLKPNRPGCAI